MFLDRFFSTGRHAKFASKSPEEANTPDHHSLLNDEKITRRSSPNKWRRHLPTALNIFILLLNVGLLLMLSALPSCDKANTYGAARLPRLPHEDWIAPAIELELRSYDDTFGNHGVFRGRPRPELDEAWADIVRNYSVRIPQPGWRNATSPERTLAEFQDEKGGLLGTFSFLHNIHCLRVIREFMLPDYYPGTAAHYQPTEEEPIPEHIDHCLDILRQSELCHADMSLMVFEWHEDEQFPVDLHHAQHVCANTEKLDRFLEANTVPPFGDILVHPWTGKAPWPV